MVVLSAQGVSRSFGLRKVLDNVSLTIDRGEHVGLVGLNGSGKSTLGRLLAGTDTPDSGLITSRRDATVGYLPQVPQLPPDRSARDIVLGGLARWSEAKRRYDEISDHLTRGEGNFEVLLAEQGQVAEAIEQAGGWLMEHEADAVLGHVGLVDTHALARTMSGGELRRVALAQLLVSRPTLAILDEPTNHLDIPTIEWLEQYLQTQFKGAILLITHDRYLLDRIVSRTCEVEDGKLYSYEGGYEDYLEAKAERDAMAERTEANRRNFLRRELEWLRRQPKARTTKSKSRVERAEAAIAAEPSKAVSKVRLESDASRSGHTILELEGVNIDVPGRRLVADLDLALSKGDRIGIVGPNGAGKTSLLRTILGEREANGGVVRRGQNTKIAYLDQNRSRLDEQASIFKNVAGERSRIQIGAQSIEFRAYLERFMFSGYQQQQLVSSLSGGERARVMLAKILSDPANLLVLDEPTNDLDVATLGALEELLVEFGGTCLVVTHDRYFLDRIATGILAFEGEGRVTRYEGNYSAYLERRPPPLPVGNDAVAAPKATKTSPPPAPPKLNPAERKELSQIEAKIEAQEQCVAEIETRLADPTTYAAGADEARALSRELDAARAALTSLMDRWEELESKREKTQ